MLSAYRYTSVSQGTRSNASLKGMFMRYIVKRGLPRIIDSFPYLNVHFLKWCFWITGTTDKHKDLKTIITLIEGLKRGLEKVFIFFVLLYFCVSLNNLKRFLFASLLYCNWALNILEFKHYYELCEEQNKKKKFYSTHISTMFLIISALVLWRQF